MTYVLLNFLNSLGMEVSNQCKKIHIDNFIKMKSCLICTKSGGLLVANPRTESYRKLLEFAKLGSSLREQKYVM